MCIGVGGADAVDVMAGLPWELKCPNVSMLFKKQEYIVHSFISLTEGTEAVFIKCFRVVLINN